MSKSEVREWLNSQTGIRLKQKKELGEVFTPLDMVDGLLDKILDKVWKDKSLVWCEPSAGVGHFAALIYFRLGGNRDILKRLIMVEKNAGNCRKLRELFGDDAQIFCGDFFKFIGKHKMPDVIVGNPPFSAKGLPRLFEDFVSESLKAKFVSMIVPDVLFSGSKNKTYVKLFEEGCVRYCDFLGNFSRGVQQPVCRFLWERGLRNPHGGDCHTKINGTKMSLGMRIVNPFRNWTPKTEKMVDSMIGPRNCVVYVRGKSMNDYDSRGKYEIVWGGKTLYTNKLELAVGYGTKKVILLVMSPDLKFIVDFHGEYGCGPNTMYVPFVEKDEGKKLVAFFGSSKYKEIMNACRASRQYLNIALVEHLRLVRCSINRKTRNKRVTKRKTRNMRN